MLEEYARKNGLPNPTHFTDDGISGTRFDRPGFTAMMEEVEAGRVEAIVVKDMSRLGRDYLKVGQVMEILRQQGVRLIAINDGVDSDKGDNDFTPFRNIMNEFYARDTSRKIKSVFKAKGMAGKHMTGQVPYGYLWADEKREQWVIDDEAAAVVRQIFNLTMEGFGPYQISQLLSQQKIEIPSVHLARYGEGVNRSKTVKDPCGWCSSTIVQILKKREYLGHTVNFKTRKWAQYEQHKETRRQLDGMKPGKREKFAERHGAELALFDTAARFLKDLKATGEAVTPKQWRAEADTLTAKKDALYSQMRAMREEVKAVESLRKAAEQLTKNEQTKRKEQER